MRQPTIITRFAPSPSGYLHLGHAFSAMQAFRYAEVHGGEFLLRIEDIDTTRCKSEFTEAIFEDLNWLGLTWHSPVRIQSQHFDDYAAALERLRKRELLYPCFCSRKDIQREIDESSRAPHGVDGPLYPGTCKYLSSDERAEKIAEGLDHCWRLDSENAEQHARENDPWPLIWVDAEQAEQEVSIQKFGDVVLSRKDTPTSYHLSVVVDDALQCVTDVVRGEDLFEATHVHRLLQSLLGLPSPLYHHHKLLRDKDGKRFAKRDKAMTIKAMRESGVKAADILTIIEGA